MKGEEKKGEKRKGKRGTEVIYIQQKTLYNKKRGINEYTVKIPHLEKL